MNTQTNTINFADVITIIKRLTQLLEQEVQMIKEMKLSQIHTLQDEKIKLLTLMENFKEVICESPELLESIDSVTKDKLIEANKDFEDLVNEDGEQLIKARKVHGIIMESIRKVLDDQRKQSMGYNGQGIVGEHKKKILTSTPFSVNSSI